MTTQFPPGWWRWRTGQKGGNVATSPGIIDQLMPATIVDPKLELRNGGMHGRGLRVSERPTDFGARHESAPANGPTPCTSPTHHQPIRVVPDMQVLDALGSLVDKSLVRMIGTVEPEPRYLVLETIRELAEERLVVSGEEHLARQRRAAWRLGITSAAPSPLRRVVQSADLLRLAGDHANGRAALTLLECSGDTSAFLKLSANPG